MDRISTAFDIRYFCSVCNADNLDRDTDLDDSAWTCKVCDGRILIQLADQAGNEYIVERCPADQLHDGDFIIQEYSLANGARQILQSTKALGKGNKWYLAIEGVGHERVEPKRYFNRIP